MKTTQTIGFANKFYTLWNSYTEIKYTMFNGQRYPDYEVTHNDYIKNVSFDIDKVKSLYPDAEIDENLKGHTQSFLYTGEGKQNLSPELVRFGKYRGMTVTELAKEDFKYLLWYKNCDNVHFLTKELIETLPEYIAYVAGIDEENKRIAAQQAQQTYFGNVGDKVKAIELMFKRHIQFDSFYGTKHLYICADKNQNCFVLESSTGIYTPNADGDIVGLSQFENQYMTFKGTIKDHKEYNGTKQTVMNRVKVV